MTGCRCNGLDREFNADWVARSLASYRQSGPGDTACRLVELIKREPIDGMTVLDIGGGIGAVQYGLLGAGATRAINVEASPAYAEAAEAEARRQGLTDRIAVYSGDFVSLTPAMADQDIVTLDRVICCYHDMPALVGLSVKCARKLYGLVYPRDTWWVRAWIILRNSYSRVRRSSFRVFLHPPRDIDTIVRGAGFRLRHSARTLFWNIVVYTREPPAREVAE